MNINNLLDDQVAIWLDEFTKLMLEASAQIIPVKDLEDKSAHGKVVRINFIDLNTTKLEHLHD